jgi:DNA invertase Pin-like site-specific DNA recombinase
MALQGVTFGGKASRLSNAGDQTLKRVALYARVSTDGQSVKNQIDELTGAALRHHWKVVYTFIDQGISGTKGPEGRPQYKELTKSIARRDIDLVAAWSVDRLGRSLTDLVRFLGELQGKGVHLYLHQQGLDTSTPSGRAMFQMLGVFAEFEAAMIKDRVKAGLNRARVHGTKSGRAIGRPRLVASRETAVKAELAKGAGILKVAKKLGLGTGTVARIASDIRRRPAASKQTGRQPV